MTNPCVLSTLPESEFLSISKGIVVCRSHILNISKDGVYIMSNGRTLLDDMPLAFCVIELVFNKDGRGVDFIFRVSHWQTIFPAKKENSDELR